VSEWKGAWPDEESPVALSDRQLRQAVSWPVAGLFVAVLAGTVVATTLPRIIADLGAGDRKSVV
jgi:hypothetical protein